nr:uncharacterized protein LOC109190936 [Ipomoea batatas]
MENARAGRRLPLGFAGAALILHCCCCCPHDIEGGKNRGVWLPFVTPALLEKNAHTEWRRETAALFGSCRCYAAERIEEGKRERPEASYAVQDPPWMARMDTRGWGATPQIPQNGKEKDRDESNRTVINVIFGGEALGEHAFVGAVNDRPTTKKPRRKPIWFSDKDLPARSSVNVMYHGVFLKLGLSEDQLTPVRTQLAGFTGNTVETEGSITLPVELGTPPHVREMHMEFVVVKVTCAHNLILGRPGLVGLGGLISMEHLRLKFHTVAGVGIVRGDQHLARKCYSTACEKLMVGPLPVHTVEPERERSTGPEPAVELEEIPLHPSRPDRCVRIGKGLTPELREQVMTVLEEIPLHPSG